MRPNTLRMLRQYHRYLGMFFAPAILLFAVSGALQTFRLNEAKGYGGPPPGWMVWLGSVHKNQTWPREPRRDAPKATAPKPSAEGAQPRDGARRANPLPLKIFVVLLSVALATSTTIGIVIGLATRATRRNSLILLSIGTALPLLLLAL